MLVRLHWETLPRQNAREDLAGRGIPDFPLPHRLHHEARVLLRAEEELDGLPHDPSLRLQRRDRGLGEGGMGEGLKTVQAAERLVDEGDALARRAEEEAVVVAVQLAVEGGELGGGEIGVFRGLVVRVLLRVSVEPRCECA